MLQNATSLRKSAPWPPNISDEHVSGTACHAKRIFADPLQMPHACHRFWNCYRTVTFCSLLTRSTIPCACHAKRHLNVQRWSEHVVLLTFWLGNFLRPTTACTFPTSQLPKAVRTWCVLYGVHCFNIATSKSAPKLRCFCTFWLGHVLRDATACNFLSLIWPDGSAPAALASLLFDPPEPQIIGKTQWFAAFLPFHAPASSFFCLFPFFDLVSSSLLLSDSSHLWYFRKFDF